MDVSTEIRMDRGMIIVKCMDRGMIIVKGMNRGTIIIVNADTSTVRLQSKCMCVRACHLNMINTSDGNCEYLLQYVYGNAPLNTHLS